MQNKTKKVTVELEIPVDMEVDRLWQLIPENINVSLKQRKPKEIIFREIIGKNYVDDGDYFTDIGTTLPMIKATSHYHLGEGHTVWELVNANT